MRKSSARGAAIAVLLAVCGLGATAVSASATNSFYIYHFTINSGGVSTYSGGPYPLSTDVNNRRFCWTVDTPHSTRVSYNWEFDYSYFEAADIPAHSQTCKKFSTGSIGQPGFEDFDVKFRGRALCCEIQYNRNGNLYL